MRNKIIVLLAVLLFVPSLFAQTTTYLREKDLGARTTWTTIAAGASNNFVFRFSGNKTTNPYSGFVSVVVWVDTSSGALPDSTTSSAHPMFYDSVTNNWEISAGKLDSLDIKDNFDLTSNHSDLVYSYSVALNVLACDGLQVNFYNTDSAQGVKVRIELRMAKDKQ